MPPILYTRVSNRCIPPGCSARDPRDRRKDPPLGREEKTALHPTGKLYPDEPSGDVAVQSDSVPPSPPVNKSGSGSESDLTTDFAPGPPDAPATKKDTPTAFGRYAVRSALGAGGFGSVYLGHDTLLDRSVAIKVLKGGADVPRAEAERFLQEARRLARLSHAGIVTVYDVGLEGGQIYIVSDFLDGPDLGQWLRENRPAWPEAARIAAAVADALAHAHTRLIVHRDVKPANIIVTPDRGPVLVDFGLGLDEAGAGGSELGVISGTPTYMAPEQVVGAAHRIDGRTDIYSLGVVLYEMLCGRLPFRASVTSELLRQVRDDDPQPPRQLRREIPPELESTACGRWRSGSRTDTPTAADFADNLRRVLQTPAESSAPRKAPIPSPTVELPSAPQASSPADAPNPPSSQRRARGAERRQVTVLVCGCELFGSEAYLELDAEDQIDALRAFRQICEEATRRFDGTIVQLQRAGSAGVLRLPGGLRGRSTPRRADRPGPPPGPEGVRREYPVPAKVGAEPMGRPSHSSGRHRGEGGRRFHGGGGAERGRPSGRRRSARRDRL